MAQKQPQLFPPCRYGISKIVLLPYAEALVRLRERLSTGGFQLLFDIDVSEEMQQHAGARFPGYRIFGTCHLPMMARALAIEPQIGLLFPCHIILYENGRHECIVMVRDPAWITDQLLHPIAIETAMQIFAKLEAILEPL
jgi:uncharacterized protein (DUF302 family)